MVKKPKSPRSKPVKEVARTCLFLVDGKFRFVQSTEPEPCGKLVAKILETTVMDDGLGAETRQVSDLALTGGPQWLHRLVYIEKKDRFGAAPPRWCGRKGSALFMEGPAEDALAGLRGNSASAILEPAGHPAVGLGESCI